MADKNAKSASYIELALAEMRKLVDEAQSRTDLKASLERYLTAKLKQSFLNGIETGRKRPAKAKPNRKE
jgi:hypothetical protein